MKQIQVIDNIVDIIQQETIKHKLLNQTEWQYVDDVSYKGNQHQRRPGFKHIFDKDNLDNSLLQFINNTQNQINHLKQNNTILEVRSFLQLPLNKDFTGSGVDTPHLDRFESHLVFLYYVCDSDGDTIIYNYKTKKEGDVPFFEDIKELKRITPKQGRVVVFDGMYWHTAEQPTSDVRCIINVNVK